MHIKVKIEKPQRYFLLDILRNIYNLLRLFNINDQPLTSLLRG